MFYYGKDSHRRLTMKRIVPISELWSKARLVFFTDTSGEIHDATGDLISNGKVLILGNRQDGKKLEIPREFIVLEETIE